MEERSLEELISDFEAIAQQLTIHFTKTKKPIKARFPRDYIRRLDDLKGRWPYLVEERRRTLACIIQLCDVNRWNLNIWDIGLTAGTVWEWHCTLPVIAVIETLLTEFGQQQGWLKKGAKFKKAINVFNSKGVYKQDLRDKLQKLRNYRNEIHLYLKDQVELYDGLPKKYNEAVQTLREVEEAILNYWRSNHT